MAAFNRWRKAAWARARRAHRPLAAVGLSTVGVLLVAYGLNEIYAPLAPLFAGAACLTAGLLFVDLKPNRG